MRTKNSIKNILSTIIPYIIIGLLGFVKVKVFVNSFSDDIYSLNQLFFQIMGYLVLADAGFGVIISQKMYKSFINGDKEEISSQFSTAKIFFKKVGYFIIFLSVILSFFVHFFAKVSTSNSYIQIIFIIFIIKNSIDYFMSAPRYVIQADQKSYKINILINLIRIIESIIEIVLAYCGINYLIILLPGIFVRIIFNIIINKKVFKEYPWLKYTGIYNKKYLKEKYSLIGQKLAGIFYSNTDIVLISTFINPLAVIVYSSYSYITKFITDVVYLIGSAITPSYANIINDKNSVKKYDVFCEMQIIFNYFAVCISVILYLVLNNFIVLWIGEKYLASNLTLVLFIYIVFINIATRVMYMTINSLGLFKESNKSIIGEAIINFVLSIILVKNYGMNGVLIGTIFATTVTTLWYFPYYIYKKVFNKKVINYFLQYIISLIIVVTLIFLLSKINLFSNISILYWILNSLVYSIITFMAVTIMFMIIFKNFRSSIERIKYMRGEKK